MTERDHLRFYWLGGFARSTPRTPLGRLWRRVHDFIAPLWMRPTFKQWVANLAEASKGLQAQQRAERLAGPKAAHWREFYREQDADGRALPYPDEVQP